MPDDLPLQMHDWTVTTRLGGDQAKSQLVNAAYHQFVLDQYFVEFKDARHASVFLVNSNDVISIRRI